MEDQKKRYYYIVLLDNRVIESIQGYTIYYFNLKLLVVIIDRDNNS